MPSRPPSDLKRVTAQYHAAVQGLQDNALADLQGRWQGVQATLDLKIKRLTDAIAAAQAKGETVNVAWLTQAQRLEQLRQAVQGDVSAFADGAADIVANAMSGAADLGQAAAQAALAATVPPGVNYTFGVPPSDVTETLAGALQPGSPLNALFGQMGSTVAAFAQQALFTGVALGEGPRQIAQRLQWATNMAPRRAEVIARTETLRSWRHAQFANYQANRDVVQQWMWAADFGPRCCSACIAMDGTFHDVDTELDDHICGRCSAIPITRSWADILADGGMSQEEIDALGLTETSGMAWAQSRESGESWLRRQSVEIQNQILGPAKAEAWRQGAFGERGLRAVVGVVHDPQWGSSIRELSLKQMGIDAQTWLQAARQAGNGSVLADAEALQAAHAETSLTVAAEQRVAQNAEAKAAADEWYQQIQRSIAAGQAGGLTSAEAKAAADEWFASVKDQLRPGGLSVEDVARAMEQRFGLAANPAELPPEAAFAPLSVPGGPYGRGVVETYELTPADRAFVEQLRAQIPPEGVKSADEAITLGRQLADRIHADPRVAGLKGWAEEAAEIRTRLPGNVTEEERAWFAGGSGELAVEAREAHGNISPFDAPGRYQAAYQAQVRAYLGALRETGGVELRVADEADAVVAARLDVAKDLLPRDWLAASNDLGELSVLKSAERSSSGMFFAKANGNGELLVRYVKASDPADLESVALHELTHRIEQAAPDLTAIEQQFYEARTAGEAFVKLTNGIKDETKLDQWLDEYLGRRPIEIMGTSGARLPDGTWPPYRKSYELMTMGVEMAMAPGAGADVFALHADSEYEGFVLGALMGVRAPAAEASAVVEGVASETAAGEAAFAARRVAGTALSAEERAAVQDAVAAGALPKSYAKYTTVEQLIKTAKGSEWYAARRSTEAAATVTYTADDAAERLTLAFPHLDTPLSDEQVAGLAGAPAGSTVTVSRHREITVTPPDGRYTSSVYVMPGAEGPLLLNWQFTAPDGSNAIAVDPEALAAQVRQANALGVDSIHMKARIGSADYAELPQLGYDAPIQQVTTEARDHTLPAGLEGAQSLSEVLATPEGRVWWAENGLNPGFDFDPRPGSRSYQVLDAYLRDHGLPGLDEAPVTAAEVTGVAEDANAAIHAATFSTEQLSQQQLRQLEKLTRKAIVPSRTGYGDAQVERVSKALAAHLANTPEFKTLQDVFSARLQRAARRSGAKMSATKLAELTTPKAIMNNLLSAWNGGSDDLYFALQQATQDEFGLNTALSADAKAAQAKAVAKWTDAMPGLRATVREMYNQTQDWLREKGISEVPLYRGKGYGRLPKEMPKTLFDGSAHETTVVMRGASSFSIDPEQAKIFAEGYASANPRWGQVIAARVPAELILSVARTGFGSADEAEVVVLGGRYDALALGVDTRAGASVDETLSADRLRKLLTLEGGDNG